ncbi:hypothetical protein KQI36_14365 [Clostridium senegalense]|nr:hypothetical protein [Clostridium senegalense]MBU5227817.1 hypothetical protein [Clostridium senegalense]
MLDWGKQILLIYSLIALMYVIARDIKKEKQIPISLVIFLPIIILLTNI